MPVTLFIENEAADLAAETPIALTFQVHDITELESRQGNYSNEFELPLTAKNRRLLGFPNAIASTSNIPYTKINALLSINGLQSLPGFLIVEEVTTDEAKCTFYSGNTGFFEALGNATLNDLDLSTYNHYWDLAGTNNVFDNKANTNGFTYPIIEYGTETAHPTLPITTRSINPKYLRPAMFVSPLMQAISNYCGYNFIGDFFASEAFTKELIPITNKHLKHSAGWSAWQLFSAYKTTDQTVATTSTDVLTFPESIVDAGSNFNGSEYTIPSKGKYTFRCTYKLSGGINSPRPVIRMVREDIDGNVQIISSRTLTGLSMVFPEALEPGELEFEHGDKVYVTLYGGADGATYDASLGGTFTCTAVTDTTIEYGNLFEFTGNMPAISLKAFIKALCQRYNLLLYTDGLSKTIEFIPFKTLYDNQSKAIDWSKKMHKRGIETHFHPDEFSQQNIFAYIKEDGDEIPGAQGILTLDDETAELTEKKITQPFAATNSISRLQNLTVPQIKMMEYDADSSTYKNNDVKPRILYLDSVILTDAITYDDGTTTATDGATEEPFAWFINEAKPFNLGFDNNLLATHYTELGYMLYRYKKLTARFNLSAADVMGFDFKKPVYLSQYSCYFYVNKIEGYTPKKLTKVELIKM
ncbi:MAG: hypothetical protein M0D57_21230 [Sphingobacteriales bacterium JAD_PAG50586_3]|nr:MAG: hypothetical protein M0D57_21230 [Sphingobacteriales bacterium JAD_PAG50586_3]